MFDADDPKRIINFRPLLYAAVGLILGIAAFEAYYSSVSSRPYSIAVLIAALSAVIGIIAFAAVRNKKALLILASAFLLAAARCAVFIPVSADEGVYDVAGIVCSVNEAKHRVTLTGASFSGKAVSAKVLVTVSKDKPLPETGDGIAFTGTVKMPSIRFDSYDERLNLLSNGVGYKASASDYEIVSTGSLPLTRTTESVRRFLSGRIDTVFGENAPIVSGFLLGDKSGIDEADTESFRTTGTAHLLTLSGFHVGILTSALFLVLPKSHPKLRFCLVSLFLLGYCAIAAFSASIVRASVMCFCMLLSEVTERKRDALSALSLSAIVILLVSPYQLFAVGFRLSFAATLGILLITSAGSTRLRSPVLKWLSGSALVTLGATAATSLISAQYFGVFPTYGLIANLTAVPLFSVAITLSFIILLIGIPFPGAAVIASKLPNLTIDGGMFLLNKIGRLPYSTIEVIPPSTLSGILMLCVMFAISAYVLRPLIKRIKLTGLVFLLFTASLVADIIIA